MAGQKRDFSHLCFTPLVARGPKKTAFELRVVNFRVADHPRTNYDQITVRSMLAIVVRPVSVIKRGESRDCAPRNEYPSASDCHSSLPRLRL